MTRHYVRTGLAISVILGVALTAEATSVRGRVVSTIPLADLIAKSDVIAQVRVVAVDEEATALPLARVKVEQAFKGTKPGQTLFVDSWSITDVGKVFLVFLDDSHELVKKQLRDSARSFAADADAPYYLIHEGLSRQMPVRLTQAFGELDVAISVPSEFVLLPKQLEAVARERADDEAELLVRQDEFYALLRRALGV